MQYDPVKRQLGSVFKRSPFLRRLFYRLLDLLLLRAWHVHRELRAWARGVGDKACLLYTSPSPRDRTRSRMPSSA